MKIIIVDDNIGALELFLNYTVNETELDYKYFKNPQTALEYAAKNKINAAFLDIDMPELDGVTLAEKLIELNACVKIFFITALDINEDELQNKFFTNLSGICHKPYDKAVLDSYIRALKEQEGFIRNIFISTFQGFEIIVDGSPVQFLTTRSKELMAVLVDANGQYRTMDEIITMMWPDNPLDSSKRLYRDAVCKLRIAFRAAGLLQLVEFRRASARIIKTPNIYCDYWDMVENGNSLKYCGNYMPLRYEWTDNTLNLLNKIAGLI